nr:immunoglobulin light chain junction region [Homo sapiens]
VYYCQQYGSSP